MSLVTPWTKDETDEYLLRRRTELGPMYAAKGIPINEPARRAEYLTTQLRLSMTDHDALMRRAQAEGRAKVLRELEDMAVLTFF